MKLIECYVSSFGKLRDFKYQFSQGLNVINKENGFGKTTLTVFIKSMFYGLEDSKRSVEDNERKKYKPWNSTEKFGGYVTFEKNGVEYKLERFFGNKESEDVGMLTDLSTGKTFTDLTNIGQKLFGVDQEGFLSTTYFSQKDFSVKSNTSLTAKFNSVCDVQDNLAFDNALAKLKDKIKSYNYTGDRGLIPQLQRDIFAVEKEILEAEKSSESAKKISEDLTILNLEKNNLKQEIDQLTEKVSEYAKLEAQANNEAVYNRLITQRDDLLSKKQKAEKILNGTAVTQREISACKNCVDELLVLGERRNNCIKSIEELSLSNNSQKTNNNVKLGVILCIFSAILCAFGVGFCFVELTVGIISIILGVFLLISGVALSKKSSVNNDAIINLKNKKKEELAEIESIIANYTQTLNGFIGKFNLPVNSIETSLNIILDALQTVTESDTALKLVNEQLNDLNYNPCLSVSVTLNQGQNIQTIKQLLSQKNNQYHLLIDKISSLTSIIKERETQAQNLMYLTNKKAEMEELLATYKEQQSDLKLTSKFLEKADENLKIRYRAPLQSAYDKYLNIMTDGLAKANIDIDFNVSVSEAGFTQPTDFYSKGYKNLFEICKRFALIEVLFEKEKPFIMLDDPFCNLDNKKLKLATNLIRNLSSEYQIIYIICHDSREASNNE